jgi:hypothetical protein
MKHTPGPWKASGEYVWHTDESSGMGYRFEEIAFNGGCLAWVAADEGDKECEANAHLIASAPELLAALEGLILELSDELVFDEHDHHGNPGHESIVCSLCMARAAIARAKGGGE